MADVLGDILKGAGDIAGGIYKGARDWGRRYRYGPYYEENQEMRTQQYESQQEAQKARKEYYEYLKKAAEAKVQNNPQQQQKLKDIVDAAETLEAMKRNPAYKNNPDMLSKIDTGLNKMLDFMTSMVGGTNKATSPQSNMKTGTFSSIGKSDNLNDYFRTIPAMPSSMIRPAGALSDIVGPPKPPDYNPYVPPGVQAKWSATPPEQRKTMMFGTDTIQRAMPETATATNEIDFYMPKLDKTSRNELQQILKSGNQALINKALQRLRDKYGTM